MPIRRSSTKLATLFAALLTAVPGGALAQAARPARGDARTPGDTDTARARAHFERGVLLFDGGDAGGALVEFERAWELSHRLNVLINVAAAAQALRRYSHGAAALRRFLAEAPAGHPQRAAAERAFRELSQLVAHARITVDPPDARLTLDGQPYAAGESEVGPGRHTYEVAREGYRTTAGEFAIASGETRMLRISLQAVDSAGSRIASAEASRSTPVGAAPAPVEPPARVSSNGPPSATARIGAWVTGGVALAVLGGAAAAWVVREGAVARFNDNARCLRDNGMTRAQNCADDRATVDTATALGWTGIAVGGALVAISAVLFVSAPRGERAVARWLRCGVGPGTVGAACGGTF